MWSCGSASRSVSGVCPVRTPTLITPALLAARRSTTVSPGGEDTADVEGSGAFHGAVDHERRWSPAGTSSVDDCVEVVTDAPADAVEQELDDVA